MNEPVNNSPKFSTKISSFFLQSKRVWHILRKPSAEEFKTVAKVSALGMLLIGLIGFIIADLMKFFG